MDNIESTGQFKIQRVECVGIESVLEDHRNQGLMIGSDKSVGGWARIAGLGAAPERAQLTVFGAIGRLRCFWRFTRFAKSGA
jgi:hypothetical protein